MTLPVCGRTATSWSTTRLGADQTCHFDTTLTGVLSAAYAAASPQADTAWPGPNGNQALLRRSASELTAAQSGFVKAEARLDALNATGPGSSS